MFNPSRLEFARQRRKITQKELADRIGVTVRLVKFYENGEVQPPPDSLEKIAMELRFPINFFFGHTLDPIVPDTVSFRAFSKLSIKNRNSALAISKFATLLNVWIERKFDLPSANLPDLRGYDPEAAAEALRANWKLGQLPIKNLIHLLESKGIRIFSLTQESKDVDAFCYWRNEAPFMFINTTKSPERTRFDAAHELGHLLLHKHATPHGREAEREADKFASAFLIPKASAISKCPKFVTLNALIKLKKIWNVSVAALNVRLHHLGLISDWHYSQMCIQISKLGYHRKEPEGMAPEGSQLLSKVFASLREEGITINDVARELGLYPEEVGSLLFGLTIAPISADRSGVAKERKKGSNHLKLV